MTASSAVVLLTHARDLLTAQATECIREHDRLVVLYGPCNDAEIELAYARAYAYTLRLLGEATTTNQVMDQLIGQVRGSLVAS